MVVVGGEPFTNSSLESDIKVFADFWYSSPSRSSVCLLTIVLVPKERAFPLDFEGKCRCVCACVEAVSNM
jgi:hypothetical protein